MQVSWMVRWMLKVCVLYQLWVNECQISGTLYGVGGQSSLLAAFASGPAFLDLSPAFPSPVFLFQVPAIEENLVDDKHLLKPWDAKKVGEVHRVSSTIPPLSFPGTALPGFPLRSVLISNPLPSLLSCPHLPLDLDPVKSLESSKEPCKAGVRWKEGRKEI